MFAHRLVNAWRAVVAKLGTMLACGRLLWVAFVLAAIPSQATATICRYVDQDGNIIYSNVRAPMNSRLLECEYENSKEPPQAAATPARPVSPATATIPATPHTGVYAQDLLQFAQKTKGLYSTEIRDKSIFDRTYTVRARMNDPLYWPSAFTYDPSSQFITIKMNDLQSDLTMQLYLNRCQNTGQYVGQNAFGVGARVTKRTCQRVVMDSDERVQIGAGLRGGNPFTRVLKFMGSPDEYRRLNATKAFDIEVVVQPVLSPNRETTKYELVHGEATLTSPVETTLHVYTVLVNLKVVRYYLPGAKKPFLVQDPANSEPRAP